MPPHVKRRKDRDGTYYLIDRRINKSLKTKVKRFAEGKLSEYNRGKFGLGPEITIREYYEQWIETKKEPLVRKSLVRSYRQHFNSYVLPEFGSSTFRQIRPPSLSCFQYRLLSRRLSIKTARNILSGSFRALWRDAMAEELVDRNPFDHLQWPRTEGLTPDPFSIEERDKILTYVQKEEPFYYPFVYVMFSTGMRPSEAIALRLFDIDAGRKTISINKSRNMGADSKPKTARSRRVILVPQEVIYLLDHIRLPWQEPDSHVFYNKWSGGPLDANQWARVYWKDICEGAGVRHRKFYCTRHTFITEMVLRGENLKAIADYCGTSVAMIDRDYCGKLSLSHLTEIKPEEAKSLESLVVPTGLEPHEAQTDNMAQPVSAQIYERLKRAKFE